MSFDNLGLRAELLRAVSEQGYTVPTPIQAQAIPTILQGKDVLAGAQTGTGKTAGFTLPVLQLLLENSSNRPGPGPRPIRCLILTPTRELAAQVEESVATYGKYVPLRSTTIFGGVNIRPQIAALQRGVDILVATPGRLLDHVQQRTLDLSHIEILVLDEADRMLDMGFIRDITRIISLLPRKRQNLLFSATFSDDIKRLADSLMNTPVRIEIEREAVTANLVSHIVHPVDKVRKRELLIHLLRERGHHQGLVFTRTKHGANKLCEQLATCGISAVAIHGNKSQPQRTRALADFKNGRVRLLVATDLAARGLDIDQLPCVINYELPNVPEDYVHRIGRTGRAGATGDAISLVCVDELKLLRDIERLMNRRIDQSVINGFKPDPTIPAEPIINGRNGPRPETRMGQRPISRPRPVADPRGARNSPRNPHSR
jgi:ATP-dependent RNA helicase RhlE